MFFKKVIKINYISSTVVRKQVHIVRNNALGKEADQNEMKSGVGYFLVDRYG